MPDSAIKRYDKGQLLVLTVIGGLTLSLFMAWLYGRVYHLGYPYNTILCFPEYTFSDFRETFSVIHNPYASIGGARNYFPMMYLLLQMLSFGSTHSADLTLTLLVLMYIATALMMPRWLARAMGAPVNMAQVLVTVGSFGFIFALDRGNVEMLVFVLMTGFFLAYLRERYKTAAFLLAMAACCKLYPGLFVLLFIREKKWRETFAFFGFSALLLIGSLHFGGALSAAGIQGLADNMKFFTEGYVIRDWLDFNHSIFGMIKAFFMKVMEAEVYEGCKPTLATIYTACILPAALLLSAYVVLIEKTLWKAVLVITLMTISFPHTSYDYTLLYMLFPLLMFWNLPETEPGDRGMAVMLGLSVIPMQIFAVGQPYALYVIIRPMVFLWLFWTVVTKGLRGVRIRAAAAAFFRAAPGQNNTG